MTRARKRAWLLIGLGAMAIGLVLLLIVSRPRTQRLPDGSILSLRAVKFGLTNEFVHGTTLEKLLGRLVPNNGFRLGKFTLVRRKKLTFDPVLGVSSLSAEFRPIPPATGYYDGDHPLRWVIRGDDGFPYIQYGSRFDEQDGFFTYINTSMYPRDSRRIAISLEELCGADWRQLAEFLVKNPFVATIQPWVAPSGTQTRQIEDVMFTLEQPTGLLEPMSTNEMWNATVRFPFQVQRHGAIETNWSADSLVIEDASGNADISDLRKEAKAGILTFETHRTVDPRYVWRIRLEFGADSGWPETNLCTLHFPMPLPSVARTNFHGVPIDATIVQGDGSIPVGDTLSVQIPASRTDLRVTFVEASDGTRGPGPGSWLQHRFWRHLRMPARGGAMEVTVAVHRNYHVEFYTKPKWFTRAADGTIAEGLPARQTRLSAKQ